MLRIRIHPDPYNFAGSTVDPEFSSRNRSLSIPANIRKNTYTYEVHLIFKVQYTYEVHVPDLTAAKRYTYQV